MTEIHGVQLPFVPIGGVEQLKKKSLLPAESIQRQSAFGELLQQEETKIKFSSHAQSRLTSRNINLSDDDMGRLETAVSKADEKGAKESLVLLRDLALVVSVRNRTVITALQGDQTHGNVFTNIDSAVLA